MSNPGLSDELAKEAVDAYEKHGTKAAAARALNIHVSTFNNRYDQGVSRGYSPEHNMENIAPENWKVKKVSTLFGPDNEKKLQWIQTAPDAQQQQEALNAAIEAFKDEIPLCEPVLPPSDTVTDLLTVYPVGDHHMGCLAWGEETGGENYDTEIAERLLCEAMGYLVDKAPPSKEAAILLLGDFLHFNSRKQETVNGGHGLDGDSRFQKVVRAAIRAIRHQVKVALEKHEIVRLIIELGNHDGDVMAILMEMFYAHFEGEPRVIVDRSPRNVHIFEFGKNLIATHHGDKIKMDKLPLVVATDWPEMWGHTKFRVVHTGHVHHDHIKEHPGLITESHGILAPKDEYAASGGWRSRQSMKVIIYHKEHGEVGRNTVTPEMLR